MNRRSEHAYILHQMCVCVCVYSQVHLYIYIYIILSLYVFIMTYPYIKKVVSGTQGSHFCMSSRDG